MKKTQNVPVMVRSVGISAVSHISIGVSRLAKSLPFYKDVLGMIVSLEREEEYEVSRLPGAFTDITYPVVRQRSIYLRWENYHGASFVVLTEQRARRPFGNAAVIHQTGINHVGFWVDDLNSILARAEAAGVTLSSSDHLWEGGYYGEPGGGSVQTALLSDPDGVLIQLDQWVERPS